MLLPDFVGIIRCCLAFTYAHPPRVLCSPINACGLTGLGRDGAPRRCKPSCKVCMGKRDASPYTGKRQWLDGQANAAMGQRAHQSCAAAAC